MAGKVHIKRKTNHQSLTLEKKQLHLNLAMPYYSIQRKHLTEAGSMGRK